MTAATWRGLTELWTAEYPEALATCLTRFQVVQVENVAREARVLFRDAVRDVVSGVAEEAHAPNWGPR